jgi:hypothetical protein
VEPEDELGHKEVPYPTELGQAALLCRFRKEIGVSLIRFAARDRAKLRTQRGRLVCVKLEPVGLEEVDGRRVRPGDGGREPLCPIELVDLGAAVGRTQSKSSAVVSPTSGSRLSASLSRADAPRLGPSGANLEAL